ncbi:MAG: 1-(5-phosphoribosyl)-5-[(5-phosphoribosylamino)methylideneamino]imidazole-4-carboxamide isomerase [Lentisphaerae bacterium]|nr:1-(5-phosphoribosyl)-5-[(5-phosphoribosylamino)methylideneamino]imidazole-4-carboxamide isomerase [Lentisphaerota bacterium]
MKSPLFQLIPAIDLKGGHCVRLRQGLASETTVYEEDPLRMARRWEHEGASAIHVVDLDGAFQGRPVHTALIKRIVAAVNIPVQVGGGLRRDEDLRELLDSGAARVILGTRACAAMDEVERLAASMENRLAVAIDAREGRVQAKGWTETTELDAVTFALRLSKAGVRTLIYTDTAVDGMMTGPNTAAINAVCRAVSCDVIASGGIASVEHLTALRCLDKANLVGAIIGKALYEGRVTLSELKTVIAPPRGKPASKG